MGKGRATKGETVLEGSQSVTAKSIHIQQCHIPSMILGGVKGWGGGGGGDKDGKGGGVARAPSQCFWG